MNLALANFLLFAAAFALATALYQLWKSLFLAGSDVPVLEANAVDPKRRELEDERRALLETLRDLKHDVETGKLSQTDFDALERTTRGRAKEVLKELDAQLDPFRDEAEKLMQKATEAKS